MQRAITSDGVSDFEWIIEVASCNRTIDVFDGFFSAPAPVLMAEA